MTNHKSPKQLLAQQRNFGKLRLLGTMAHLKGLANDPTLSPMDKARAAQARNLLIPIQEKWDADTKHQISSLQPKEFFITFPQRLPTLKNAYFPITAWTESEARDIAFDLTGGTFAFLYPMETQRSQIQQYNLKEANRQQVLEGLSQ